MRLSGTKTGSANQYNGLGDQLYDLGGARPTLDLNFANNGSLVDSVTGKTLVTHTRASSGTYVDGDGIIKDAVTNLLTYSEDFTNAVWPTSSTATITTNTGIDDPQGTNTAATITNVSGPNLHRLISGTAGIPYTYSVWLRRRSGSGVIYLTVGDAISQVVTVGNTWTRVSATNTPTSTVVRAYVVVGSTGDSIDIWGAQLEQSSTVGEYVKTTSTINSAPRFDHKVTRTTTNLIPYSEDFGDSNWTKSNASVTSNILAAPNGELTADKLVEDSADSGHFEYTNLSWTAGQNYILSVHVKQAEAGRYLSLCQRSGAAFSSNLGAVFDPATGEVTANTLGANLAGSYSLGNGWYRCWILVTPSSTATTSGINIRISDDSSTIIDGYQGNGTSGLYLWGAQLEQNSDVGPYVKTTGAAATKVDAESLGLLVEEERENLLTYSEKFSDPGTTGWLRIASNIDSDAIKAPDGNNTADKLIATGGATEHNVYKEFSATAGTTYTFSCFLKAAERSSFELGFRVSGLWPSGQNQVIEFTLTGSGSYSVSTGSATGNIIALGNGWYRCHITATAAATGTAQARVQDTYGADGEGIYIWGAQLEEGSFPTSYIRTEGSTATRSPDVTSIEGNDFGTFNLLDYSEEFDNASWTLVRSSVTPNAVIAPNGTATADSVEATDIGSYIQKLISAPAGTYTLSVYLKAAPGNSSNQFRLRINDSVGGLNSGSIFTITESWQRYSFTVTVSGSVTYVRLDLTNAAIGDTIYFWGAQLEESSTATPYVKSDVTWTSRASNAWYYDYTGTLRKNSYNLITDSEDIASWPSTAGVTKTADQAIAPDGTLTADYIEFGDANRTVYKFATVTAGLPYTASVYVKGTAGETIRIASSGLPSTDYTLDGTWQRLTTSGTNATTTASVTISTFGDVTARNVYLWGAQLETGPYAGDYVKTEGSAASSARTSAFLPDGSGNFVSAGELLVEESRTNLITYSEASVANWNKAAPGITTADLTDNAFGRFNGVRVTDDGADWHGLNSPSFSATSGTSYAVTAFAKYGTANNIRVTFRDNIAATESRVQGSPGNLAVTAELAGTISNVTEELRSDNTVKITFVVTANSTSSNRYIRVGPATTNNSDVIVYAVQVEEGAFPTSYIPTYGSTATRAADVSSSSSNTFGNSFYNQTEGTVFSSTVSSNTVTSANDSAWGFDVDATTGSNRIWLYHTKGQAIGSDSGSTQYALTVGTINAGQTLKAGFAFKENDIAYSQNSATPLTDTSATLPTVDRLYIGKVGYIDTELNGTVSRLTVWPTRLSNDTLQTITA